MRLVRSIHVKFLLVLLPFVVIAGAASSFVAAFNDYKQTSSRLVSNLETLAKVHADLLVPYLRDDAGTGGMVPRIIWAVAASPEVEQVVLVDAAGQIVESVGKVQGDVGSYLTIEVPLGSYRNGRVVSLGKLSVIGRRFDPMLIFLDHLLDDAPLMIMIVASIVAGALIANRYVVGRPLERFLDALRSSEELGAYQPVQWKSSDEFGDVIAAYNTMRQQLLTEETALQESEGRLRMILESSPLGITIVNPSGTIEFANPRIAEMLRISKEEILDCHATDFYASPEERTEIGAWLSRGGRLRDIEMQIKRADTSVFPALLSFEPVRLEGHDRYICWIYDLTDRKEVEDELQASKQTLEVQAAQLRDLAETYGLEKMRAERATSAKSEFLASMSHEIRTPMNAIMALIGLALQTKLTAQQSDYLTKAETAAQSLLGIINDILDFSKIEAGKQELDLVEFALDHTLGDIASILAIEVEKKNLELIFLTAQDVPTYLVGDPLRLGQILLNLANNAVKFTERGEIVVRTWLEENLGEKVILGFSITDSGIGIGKEAQANLFGAFSQADGSTTRKYGGTGLGLAISKRLIELMGGVIAVESTPGEGSTFTFTATFGVQQGKRRKPRPVRSAWSDPSVLLVGTGEAFEATLAECLAPVVPRTTCAETAESAIAAVEQALEDEAEKDRNPLYDFIVIDGSLADMNCVDAARRIRKATRVRRSPTIFLTTPAHADEIQRRAVGLSSTVCLTGSVTESTLRATIANVLCGAEHGLGRQRAARPQAQLRDDLRGARILVVEDTEINQEIAQKILEKAGLVVEIAGNGRIAVERLAADPDRFVAILMDIQMPEMDGYEATLKIRQELGITDLPIVAMTAHAFAEERRRCIDVGMNDHVAKPVDVQQLFATLNKWIGPQAATATEPPKAAAETPDANDRGKTNGLSGDLPGIDVQEALRRLDIDEAFFTTLLAKFHHKNRAIAEEIHEALAEKDFDRAERIAHQLKGMAGNISANQVHIAAGELEAALREDQTQEVPELVARLEAALTTVIESTSRLA